MTMNNELTITFSGGKKVDAHFNGFDIHTDQSVRAGGSGSAPEPYALFLASLGTCAGIYVLNFCQSREISTEGIRLVEKLLPDPSGTRIGEIAIEIEVPPTFPEKYYDALVRAASGCAVKKTIEHPPQFTVRTVVK